jgi:hypothetical protein
MPDVFMRPWARERTLREPEPDSISSLGVIPIQSVLVADHQTGAALHTRFVGKVDLAPGFIPHVAADGAREGTALVHAFMAGITHNLDMCFRVNPVTDQVKYAIDDHVSDFPIL